MAQIAQDGVILKNIVFEIGADGYEFHVNKVQFDFATSEIRWNGFNGSEVVDTAAPTTTLNIDYIQDWTTSNSLSKLLFTNVGSKPLVKFGFDEDGGHFESTVTLTPGSIGGALNTAATASVSLPATFPTWVPAV